MKKVQGVAKNATSGISADLRSMLSRLGRGKILAAVSGGADSVALLVALTEAGADVEVANCNFHLRGGESDRDSRSVEELCSRLGVKLHRIDFDASQEAEKHSESIEMACRRLRHEWFGSLMQTYGFIRLATGHNAGDNAETLLLNLLRGSGIAGLKGMLPDDGRVIRPLLRHSREEILRYLEERGETYVTDSTNLESDYRRNYLRNEVMPMLREKWAGADRAIARTLEVVGKEYRVLSYYIDKALEGSEEYLTWEKINGFPEPSTLIFHYIRESGGSPEIASEIARSLPRPEIGKRWHLGGGRWAVAERNGLSIHDIDTAEGLRLSWEKVEITDTNREEIMKRILSAGSDEGWFSRDPEQYELRRIAAGYRIQPLGMHGSRLCSDIVREGKLTTAEKERLRVLVEKETGKVVWIPGLKRSRNDLISADATTAWRARRVES